MVVCVCSGGRDSGGAGGQVRAEEVDADRTTPEGPNRQAVPRAVAQPSQPQHQEDGLDRRGGQDHLQRSQAVGQPVGQDCQTAARQVIQRGS